MTVDCEAKYREGDVRSLENSNEIFKEGDPLFHLGEIPVLVVLKCEGENESIQQRRD